MRTTKKQTRKVGEKREAEESRRREIAIKVSQVVLVPTQLAGQEGYKKK